LYEHRRQPVLPRRDFIARLGRHAVVSAAFVAVSLVIGTVGYHAIAGLAWIDAFLNASMILTGMGPVNSLTTSAAKLFASCYALYSGIVFVAAVGVVAVPILHRLLHRFHVDG